MLDAFGRILGTPIMIVGWLLSVLGFGITVVGAWLAGAEIKFDTGDDDD